MDHAHHSHTHGHEHGHHHHHTASGTTLLIALGLTLGFALVEAVGGWLAHSLALLGDAGHMVSDATALGLAALAAWLAKKPPSAKHSYGLLRAEAIAALFNGLFMLAVVGSILWAAYQRFQSPVQVAGETVMLIAIIGMLINILVAWVLMRGEQNLNTRGALLHVFGDLLGSVAALLSGVVIYFTGWQLIDPLLSLLICGLILMSTLRLLREVFHVLMEGVPVHLDYEQVGQAMARLDGVASVHDLHIWTLASGKVALSAHVLLEDMARWPELLQRCQQMLQTDFHIEHVTLQPEPASRVLRRMDWPA